jgi:hypothetical protein
VGHTCAARPPQSHFSGQSRAGRLRSGAPGTPPRTGRTARKGPRPGLLGSGAPALRVVAPRAAHVAALQVHRRADARPIVHRKPLNAKDRPRHALSSAPGRAARRSAPNIPPGSHGNQARFRFCRDLRPRRRQGTDPTRPRSALGDMP